VLALFTTRSGVGPITFSPTPTAVTGVCLSVCLFIRTINQKPMQLGSPNSINKCSTMNTGKPQWILENQLFWLKKVKGQCHQSQKQYRRWSSEVNTALTGLRLRKYRVYRVTGLCGLCDCTPRVKSDIYDCLVIYDVVWVGYSMSARNNWQVFTFYR